MKADHVLFKEFIDFYKSFKDYLNQLYNQNGYIEPKMVVFVAYITDHFIKNGRGVSFNEIWNSGVFTFREAVDLYRDARILKLIKGDENTLRPTFDNLPMHLLMN